MWLEKVQEQTFVTGNVENLYSVWRILMSYTHFFLDFVDRLLLLCFDKLSSGTELSSLSDLLLLHELRPFWLSYLSVNFTLRFTMTWKLSDWNVCQFFQKFKYLLLTVLLSNLYLLFPLYSKWMFHILYITSNKLIFLSKLFVAVILDKQLVNIFLTVNNLEKNIYNKNLTLNFIITHTTTANKADSRQFDWREEKPKPTFRIFWQPKILYRFHWNF
jgi:hypothetical protein